MANYASQARLMQADLFTAYTFICAQFTVLQTKLRTLRLPVDYKYVQAALFYLAGENNQ